LLGLEEKGMKRKMICSLRSMAIMLAVIWLALPAVLTAQAAQKKAFSQPELDQLMAPVALYPDEILAKILMASTYPLEVVEAERWVKQNKGLKGDALKASLEKQSWDDSVKSLASFPDVLFMMSDKLDWTQKLGDAFLAQQKDVMDTVQKLRAKAVGEGTLKSSKEQEVKKDGDAIIIQPANPQVVYIPAYDPVVVYGPWWYPAYPPYQVYAYPPGTAVVVFKTGVVVGVSWYAWAPYPYWHGGVIVVPPPPPPPPPHGPGPTPPPPPHGPGPAPAPPGPGPQPAPPHPGPEPSPQPEHPGTVTPGGGDKTAQWKHDPEHRKGVAYRDDATRNLYSPAGKGDVDSRMDYRGYDRSGADVQGSKAGLQTGQTQERMYDRQSSGEQSRDNIFEGMDRGDQVQRERERGRQSILSGGQGGGSSSWTPSGSFRGRRRGF
jgi:hypothetical protein